MALISMTNQDGERHGPADLPTVSCVIACYNAETTLARAVHSALQQSECSVEVSIIDDHSTDGSWALAQALAAGDPRVRATRNAQNVGPASTRNNGIAAATGQWIGVLDADDEYEPGRLSALIELAERHAATIVFDNQLVVPTGTHVRDGRIGFEGFPAGEILLHDFLNLSLFKKAGLSIGYAKPLWLARGTSSLRYDPRWLVGEDWRFLFDAIRLGRRCAFLDAPLYIYHRQAASLTHGQRNNWWRVWAVYRTARLEAGQTLQPNAIALLKQVGGQALKQALRKEVIIVLSYLKRQITSRTRYRRRPSSS